MRASPEGTNGLGWIRLGSAGGRGPMAEAGEGRGGKRREGVGPIRAQLLEAAGAPAPRAPVLTEDKVVVVVFFFLDWELFGELCTRSGDRSVLRVRAFILKLI